MGFRKIPDHPTGFEQNREKGFWSIVVPESTFNLFPDPSFEGPNKTANLTASAGGYYSPDPGEIAFGKDAIKPQFSTPPNTLTYTFSNSDSIFTPSKVYTWSFHIKAHSGNPMTAQVIWSNGSAVLATQNWTATDYKERHILTFTVPSGMTTGQSILFVIKDTGPDGWNYTTDAWQLEQKPYATTYIDGDQPGGQWVGTPYASASHRPSTVAGGRIYEFKKDLSFSIMAAQGAGLPPMNHQTSDQAVRGGKQVLKTLPAERTITLVGALEGRSEDEIERKRDILEQILSPKTGQTASSTPPPLLLRHTAWTKTTQKSKEVEAVVYYAGGLEWDNQSIYQDRIALQFCEFLPLGFQETSENFKTLSVLKQLNTSNAYLKRITGEWVALPRGVSPTSGVSMTLAEDVNHTLWIANGSGTAFVVDKIQSNPISGEKIVHTNNSFNGPVLALAPFNGGVLCGGSYTGGIPYIGMNRGSGTGLDPVITLNNTCRAIWVDPTTGKIWLGGDFTGAGPGGASNRLIVLNPDFSVYCTLNATKAVYAIAPGPNPGQAYIGSIGGGASINGNSYNAVCLVTIADGVSSPVVTVDPMSSSANNYVNGDVYCLTVGPDGTLYAGGKISGIGSGPVIGLSILKYSQGHWQTMGLGLANTTATYYITSIAFDKYGNVYAAGNHTLIYGSQVVTTPGYSVWDGSIWLPEEHTKQSSISTQIPLGKILVTSDNRRIVTYESASNNNFYFAAENDIVNQGSAPAYPRIKIRLASVGSGRIYKLVNFSTKTEIYLNYSISYQEVLTLDFTPGAVDIVSNLYGSIKSKILSNSKLTSFRLQEGKNGAGSNRIMLLVDSPLVQAEIYWRNTFWGAAGGARP
ncbi:MAG: hypothetical protein BGO39_05070 [Chloroflexi bacterium 54-19]|nr:MAG: hypothetical protein BGO39_05070 [Chloroflexi bacterium 54-19]